MSSLIYATPLPDPVDLAQVRKSTAVCEMLLNKALVIVAELIIDQNNQSQTSLLLDTALIRQALYMDMCGTNNPYARVAARAISDTDRARIVTKVMALEPRVVNYKDTIEERVKFLVPDRELLTYIIHKLQTRSPHYHILPNTNTVSWEITRQ